MPSPLEAPLGADEIYPIEVLGDPEGSGQHSSVGDRITRQSCDPESLADYCMESR